MGYSRLTESAVRAVSELPEFGSCESFTMASRSKRGAEEMEAAPAVAPASRAPAESGVRELFMELSGKNDGIDRIRVDLQESLKQQSEQLARCMERMRRDQEAGDSCNNWQKGINLQLDLFEDAGRFLKRAEDVISGSSGDAQGIGQRSLAGGKEDWFGRL